ncbi:caspase family protein [Candidatus Uabimicrobium amorphum]|uniref:Peptidase C14 caspase domain-containing protein n=1 Tax=Uabimicrobium amorphum TaxID=2596890 RepID=A0A5S9F644_UABAM|nr:caspase family protein [Candidatus Uabimicrobium amorphum]BBM86224.1 hypothetical protein UABAM_04610 [Candidatus Uabimicrobium amorphum]
MKSKHLLYPILYCAICSLVIAQSMTSEFRQQIDEIVTQLKSSDVNQHLIAFTALKNMKSEAVILRRQLLKLVKEGQAKNAIKYAIDIIDSSLTPKQKRIKSHRSIVIRKRNLGGLNILGHSRDFSNGFKYNKCHALVIGINQYDRFSDLSGPNFDAAEVAGVLTSRYHFQNVVLLVDERPSVLQRKVKWHIRPKITQQTIKNELQQLAQKVQPGDALFFYYAGHGIPGYLVTADSSSDIAQKPNLETMISLTEVAKQLESMNARHTLMVLDCCFSGSILEAKYRPHFSHLTTSSFFSPGGNNLRRIFERRVFQVITAGAGDEAVADKLNETSTIYAQQFKDTRGHSPFTAILLQALQGVVGRADGTILTSQLGYYMTDTLVNDERIGASQAPRYGTLYGNGDFMFFPKNKVLNPKFIEPLYLEEESYDEFKQSACAALQKFILQQPSTDRIALTQSAIPHMSRLLVEKGHLARYGAVTFLEEMARRYRNNIDEFRDVISPLITLFRQQSDETLTRQIVHCLGLLSRHSKPQAVEIVRRYSELQQQKWDNVTSGKHFPLAVQQQIEKITKLRLVKTDIKKRMDYWYQRCKYYLWLNDHGLALVKAHEAKMTARHNKGRTLLEKAKRHLREKNFFAAKMLAARAIGFNECGPELPAFPPLLRRDSDEWQQARLLLMSGPDFRMLWRSPLPIKSDYIAVSHNKKWLAAVSRTVRIWDVDSGTMTRSIGASSDRIRKCYWSSDDRLLITLALDHLQCWRVKDGALLWSKSTKNASRVALHSNCIASVGYDKNIYLWNIKTGQQIKKISNPVTVFDLHFDDRGQHLFCASQRNGVLRYNIANEKLQIWNIGRYSVTDIDVYKQRLVAARGFTLQLWHTHRKSKVIFHENKVAIERVAFCNNGRYIAYADKDYCVYLWDTVVKKSWLLTKMKRAVTSLNFCRNKLVIGAYGYFEIWNYLQKELLSGRKGHQKVVEDVIFSPDGSFVASCSEDSVKLWDVSSGRQQNSFANGAERVVFHPQKNILLISRSDYSMTSGKYDVYIETWNLSTGKKTQIWKETAKYSTSAVCYSPDGNFIAASINDSVKIWHRGQLYGLLKKDNIIRDISFDPSGTLLAYCCQDALVTLWDVKKKKHYRTFKHYNALNCVAFHPLSNKLVVGSDDGRILIWDIKTSRQIKVFDAHRSSQDKKQIVNDIVFTPNGKILASCGGDGTIRLWNTNNWQTIAIIQGNETDFNRAIFSIDFSPDGKTLASGDSGFAVKLWDVSLNNVLYSISGSHGVKFSPDGKTIASSTYEGVGLWDSGSSRYLTKLDTPWEGFFDISFTGEDQLAIANRNDDIELWDISTRSRIGILENNHVVRHMTVSPDKQLCASVDDRYVVNVWNLKSQKLVSTFQEKYASYVSLNNNMIAITSSSRVQIWKIKPRKLLTVLKSYSGCTAFHPKLSILAVAQKHNIRLWDFKHNKTVGLLSGHKNYINHLQFSDDGALLASASRDNTVKIWNVEKQHEVKTLHAHSTSVDEIDFISHHRLASATMNKVNIFSFSHHPPQYSQYLKHRLCKFIGDDIHFDFSPNLYNSYSCPIISPKRNTHLFALTQKMSQKSLLLRCLWGENLAAADHTMNKHSIIDKNIRAFFVEKAMGYGNQLTMKLNLPLARQYFNYIRSNLSYVAAEALVNYEMAIALFSIADSDFQMALTYLNRVIKRLPPNAEFVPYLKLHAIAAAMRINQKPSSDFFKVDKNAQDLGSRLILYYQKKISLAKIQTQAEEEDNLGMFYYYIGLYYLINNDSEKAKGYFRKCINICEVETYTMLATVEMEKLQR